MQALQTELTATQSEIAAALDKVQQELTADQWQSLPEAVRAVRSSPVPESGDHGSRGGIG